MLKTGTSVIKLLRSLMLILSLFFYAHIMFGASAKACGTIDMFVDKYFERGRWSNMTQERASRQTREISLRQTQKSALSQLDDCAIRSSYHGRESDLKLLELFYDFYYKRGGRDGRFSYYYHIYDVNKIVEKYNCLYGARDDERYRYISKYLSCSASAHEKYANWYMVNVPSGARIRDKPTLKGKKIATVPQYTMVDVLEEKGDWMKVKVVQYQLLYERPMYSGYMYRSLLVKY
ncbi:hypothetical protein ACLHDG_05120 [Sulfurovum sp. CS9]|uniref:hypothetical protein n=1 Tax=Sulfurovum sp. CS9 TaxID=3391146 RepID=UPI0039EA2309